MSTLVKAESLTAADLKENIHDIQDNVVAPILMRYGRHIFFKFTDGQKARAWLRNMFKHVNARQEEHGTRFTVNIGFTYEGLKALGLSQRSLDSFPQAFRVGMRGVPMRSVTLDRMRRNIGRAASAVLIFMLWVGFEPIRTKAATWRRRSFATRWKRPAASRSGSSRTRRRSRMKTGSDQRASISVLPIRFHSRQSRALTRLRIPATVCWKQDGTWRPLKPGEFLLGYEDEAGPAGTQTPEPFELRLNGTYMVFRKLYQDVAAFRRYLATAAKSLYGSDDQHHQDLVAAKMMGRWRSGCPVDLSPDKDDLAIAADPQRRNNFTYAGDDQGLRCPLGSHLRRSNPRATPMKRATAVQAAPVDSARRRVWPTFRRMARWRTTASIAASSICSSKPISNGSSNSSRRNG